MSDIIKARLYEIEGELRACAKALKEKADVVRIRASLIQWSGDDFDILNIGKNLKLMKPEIDEGIAIYEKIKALIDERAALKIRIKEG